MKRRNGEDLTKWFIVKVRDAWIVCPPVIHEIPNWHRLGGVYTTGNEALTAFARGGRP